MARPPAVDTVAHQDASGSLITGEAVALDLRPTGYVLRAAGAAIDVILYFGGYFLLLLVISSFAGGLGLDDALLTAVAVAVLVVCVVVVPTAVELLSRGRSLGRLAVGARIVRDDGGAIGFRHAFIRSLTAVLELFMTFGGVAALVGLLDPRARRLGDMLAGTYSQHERIPRSVPPSYGVPQELEVWAQTADVARMPDALARRLGHFLQQAGGFAPATRARLAQELAAEASAYVSPLPATSPELLIAAVVAVRREREAVALQGEQAARERLAPVLRGIPRGLPDRG